jgi:hypothetical protein
MRIHAQDFGQDLCLIDPAAAGTTDVNLLQRDDIGGAALNHTGNTLGGQLLVRPDAGVDVIGKNSSGAHEIQTSEG